MHIIMANHCIFISHRLMIRLARNPSTLQRNSWYELSWIYCNVTVRRAIQKIKDNFLTNRSAHNWQEAKSCFARKKHTLRVRTENVGESIGLRVSDTLGHTGRPINELKLVSCWQNAMLITPVATRWPRINDKSLPENAENERTQSTFRFSTTFFLVVYLLLLHWSRYYIGIENYYVLIISVIPPSV